MTVTKAELGNALFAEVGLNKREAKELVDAFFESIAQALEHGRAVKLAGFGSFMAREKAARWGRNPRTGAQAHIPSRRVIVFRASPKLKSQVADNMVVLTQKLGRE